MRALPHARPRGSAAKVGVLLIVQGTEVCISVGRATFDGARQSGHATDTPLRRLIDRATSDLANESEHDAHIAWEHSKTVASAVSLS